MESGGRDPGVRLPPCLLPTPKLTEVTLIFKGKIEKNLKKKEGKEKEYQENPQLQTKTHLCVGICLPSVTPQGSQ